MKILVFSDSHRDVESMEKVARAIKSDMILHLGDHCTDGIELEQRLEDIPVIIVKGNCDLWTAVDDEKMLDLDGCRIFMTHGHEYGVRNGYSTILEEGRKREADIVLCGHTHIPRIIKKQDICIMNPGAVGEFARGPFRPSFGIIDTGDENKCSIEKVSSVI
ncbi:MAG: YfcE family phosphodiesterase [Clostridia bacterium]|nr:YfcE family phosphodiesterase [Clostridia bacterium]